MLLSLLWGNVYDDDDHNDDDNDDDDADGDDIDVESFWRLDGTKI